MRSKNIGKMMAFVTTVVLVFSLLTVAMPSSLAAETTDHIEADDIVVAAGEEANITVTAYNETGEPVEGENITVEENDDDLNGIDVGDTVETDENGTAWFSFTETEMGEYIVNFTAEDTTIYDNATVTVGAAEVTSVEIEPTEDMNITAGETVNFTAEAYDEYDNLITEDVADFEWQNIRDFNETANVAIFDQAVADDYDVNATYGDVDSDTVEVTVEEAGVDEVMIDPDEDQEIVEGETRQFSAEAYADGELITDYAEDFTWENTCEDEPGLFNEDEPGVYEVTATFEEVTSETTTVTVLEAPYFEVDITAPEEDAEFFEEEEVTVEYTVTNTGEAEDTQSIAFRVGGVVEDIDADISLDGGESETGEFSWEAGEPDEYVLWVTSDDEEKSVTITVIEEVEPEPFFEVEITDYDDEVEEDDTVTVEFTITNTGDIECIQDIVFSVDGAEEDRVEEVTLEAGATYEGEFEWEAGEPDDYELEVASDDDSDSVTVTVEEEDDDIPGFTAMLLILGAVGAVAIYHKKRQ